MSETYQNKYAQYFEKDSKCNVLNIEQFNGTLNIAAGKPLELPVSQQRVKDAIETLDKEGLLNADIQWWAIYRVLSMPRFGYPVDKAAFCKSIENLNPQTAYKCVYDNWRKVQIHKLAPTPDHWKSVDNLSTAEGAQKAVGIRLYELLE